MLARPIRRQPITELWGGGGLNPQNERELRRSEGSSMLIGLALEWTGPHYYGLSHIKGTR